MNPSSVKTPHVFTLTGNLLAERTLEFDHWSPGRTQRARRETFQVGGKGINVSKMLTRLGVTNQALCFTGGAPGAECERWLREHAFSFRTFATQAATRAGTVVRDTSGSHAETTFLGPDVPPDAAAANACGAFLDEQCDGQLLALCGSFPGWTTTGFERLRAAIQRWSRRGELIVDSYGPALGELIRNPLSLLKINAEELRSIGCAQLGELPASVARAIITDGPRAVHIRDVSGGTESFTPPRVREISATGSGDVLLACVIEALFVRKLPLSQAVRFAIPYGAANAAHPGVAEFPLPAPDV